MPDRILLNGQDYFFEENNFPCFINYAEKAGGSHFSVTMVANLFLRGHKLLILTAYPMAKDNFLQQVAGYESAVTYVSSKDQLNSKSQAIILESGNEELYLRAINILDDIDKRIILIKNIEVFSKTIFNKSLGLKNLILSGNVDLCVAKDLISKIDFSNIIIFTKPEIVLPFEMPHLEKYIGYFWNKDTKGFVEVSSVGF